jgi:tetratricopeptide (TPR) repeat protein
MAMSWKTVSDAAFLLLLLGAGGYVGYRSLQKSAEPVALALKWVITAVLIFGTIWLLRRFPLPMWPVVVLFPAIFVGILWAPSVGAMIAAGITGGMDGGDVQIEPQPFYSIAEAKRRNTQYEEAIQLVREQLEKFPGDFPGTMLLASIQAENMHDLPGAEATLESWIQGPAATLQGIASALTAMADWHLQFAQDPEAARVALERIVEKMPNTPLAHRAAQRLAHLPTVEHLQALRAGTALDLPAGEKYIGLRKAYTEPAAVGDHNTVAEGYVKQLEQHPADTDTREKLALLYAEHFQRLDLAVDQLEQLIQCPNESPKHIARWLNLLADLHIRGNDVPAAETALLRIQEMFPNTGLAEPTRERLAALQRETKAGQKTTLKTLGRYEKNIGLKPTKET